jgi:membrane-bound serine protease (ClpP class)
MTFTIAIIVACILAAMIFFLFEFLTPTFGPLAVMGLISLCGAVWAAYTISPTVAIVLGVAMGPVTLIYIIILLKVVPKTRFGRKLFLDKVSDVAASGAPAAAELAAMIGKTALAETTLRPGGAVRVNGRRVHARAQIGMIEKGQQVLIVSTSGNEVIVRPME